MFTNAKAENEDCEKITSLGDKCNKLYAGTHLKKDADQLQP